MLKRIAPSLVLVALLFGLIHAQGKGNSAFGDFDNAKPLSGDAPPRMHLKDTEGKEMDLRDYLGSWVMIEFGSYT